MPRPSWTIFSVVTRFISCCDHRQKCVIEKMCLEYFNESNLSCNIESRRHIQRPLKRRPSLNYILVFLDMAFRTEYRGYPPYDADHISHIVDYSTLCLDVSCNYDSTVHYRGLPTLICVRCLPKCKFSLGTKTVYLGLRICLTIAS